MLRTGPKRKFIYAASGYIYVIGGLLASLIIWLMDIEKDDKWIEQKPILWLLIERFQEISIWLLSAVALVVAATCAGDACGSRGASPLAVLPWRAALVGLAHRHGMKQAFGRGCAWP